MSGDTDAPVSRALAAITARHAAGLAAPITDGGGGMKHYGLNVDIGGSTATIWHCTDDRTHEDHAAEVARGADLADLYCDSHYATVDDVAAYTFLVNVQPDLGALLPRLAELERAADAATAHLPHGPARIHLTRALEALHAD